ncbi:MAG TPA: glycosyltransferase family 4 protein [Patescibacteria group bacterium]|nr:glycosyltransferase family 4 protein [Patescibacteria group bacterium]
MRLLFIVDNDEPHASGGGYYAPFKFAEFLARRGHQVTICAVHDLGWVKEAPGLRLRFRPSIPRRNRLLRKLDKLLAAACDRLIVRREIARLRPDWVFGVLTHSAIKAAALGRRQGARVANFVYETPGWLEEMHGREAYERENRGYVRDLWERTRRAYLDSDLLIPNSAMAGRYCSRWLGGRPVGEPVPPGVDPAQMPFAEEAAPGRTSPAVAAPVVAAPIIAAPARARPALILAVGRLAKEKRLDTLVAAWLRLGVPAELHVVGEGPERGRLESQAGGSRDAHFHGFVSDADLWALYRGADLVVCPSSFEGFGMPPMQALYFARPCLASDLPVFRSLYGDHLDYFPVGDAEALAAAIRRLLADPDGRARRGREGRAFVLERFTWAGAAIMIETALRSHGDAATPGATP